MIDLIKIIIQVIHIVSFCGVTLVGLVGAIYEIIGHVKFEHILTILGITKGFERIWVIGIILLFLLIITYFIKVKLFS